MRYAHDASTHIVDSVMHQLPGKMSVTDPGGTHAPDQIDSTGTGRSGGRRRSSGITAVCITYAVRHDMPVHAGSNVRTYEFELSCLSVRKFRKYTVVHIRIRFSLGSCVEQLIPLETGGDQTVPPARAGGARDVDHCRDVVLRLFHVGWSWPFQVG